MGLFNRYTKPGKGVKKSDVIKKFTFKRFFVTLGDKFWNIVVVNLIFFATNLPLFALWAYTATVGGVAYPHPANVLFQPLAGIMKIAPSPALTALYGTVGTQVENYYPSAVTYVLLGVGLLTLLTFGVTNAAMTFVLRNFIRREPVDLAPDYFGTMKKNWKQGIALGLIDALFLFVIGFDIVTYLTGGGSFVLLLMLYLTVFLAFLYFCMRPYLYLQIVTFDVTIRKAMKNAYILAIAGIGRNLLFTLLSLGVGALDLLLFLFLPPLGAALFFLVTVALMWFVQLYGAWPLVKQHMIDPFYEEKEIEPEEEAVFRDNG